MAVVANRTASEEDFGKALRWARLAEAAHRDALAQLDNAAAIRLQLMADRLAPVLPTGIGLAGPLAAAGERPRLWIDLVLFIEMALDPKTYRLSLEGSDGRVVLFETQDPAEMAERVLREVAQLAVARERQLATVRPDSRPPRRFSAASLLVSWLAGLTAGVLALLAYLIHMKLL